MRDKNVHALTTWALAVLLMFAVGFGIPFARKAGRAEQLAKDKALMERSIMVAERFKDLATEAIAYADSIKSASELETR